MKMFRCLAVLAIVVSLGYFVTLAAAQNNGGQPSSAGGTRVAVLDVHRIFKEHKRFKDQIEELKRELQATDQWVRAEREKLTKRAEQLQTLTKGTPEYNQIDSELTDGQAKLMIAINRSKTDFFEKESTIHYGVYQEICQATVYVCQQHGIDLVLQCNNDEIEPQRRETVLNAMTRPVVWSNPNLDITGAVLDGVNRSSTTTASPNRGPATPWQR